jgi:ankyrin repeat protein
LLQAAYKGYLDLCKLLVERGADLNLQDKVRRHRNAVVGGGDR